MPSVDRRRFLHLFGAAGLTPFLPSLPLRAAAATPNLATSKALWAGIYAKSGSVPKFVGVAKGMGLSNAALQGVSARSVGVRISAAVAAQTTPHLARAVPASPPVSAEPSHSAQTARKLMRDLTEAAQDETQDLHAEFTTQDKPADVSGDKTSG